ncbi:hypothetical protein [Nannocystis pusilla]
MIVARVGLEATRRELLQAFPSLAGTLAALTVLANLVVSGLRMM